MLNGLSFPTSVWSSDPCLLHDAVISERVQGVKALHKVSSGSIQTFVLCSIMLSGFSFSLPVLKYNDTCEEKENALDFLQFCIMYCLNQLLFFFFSLYVIFLYCLHEPVKWCLTSEIVYTISAIYFPFNGEH